MKKLLLLAALAGFFSCSDNTTERSGETTPVTDTTINEGNQPIAPFPNIPQNIPNRPVYERIKKDFAIPLASRVGVPAYPGSYAVTGQSEMDLKTKVVYPSIILVTTDAEEEVIDYYRKTLEGWSFDEAQQIFWQGEGSTFPNDERGYRESVYVKKSSQPLAEVLLPEGKTEIIITYSPEKK